MPARKKASENQEQTKKKTSSTKRSSRKTDKGGSETAVAKTPRRKSTGKHLVIVESPAKAKTIQKYLGADFEVAASYGHIRDLPEKTRSGDIGIDIEGGWKPTYVIAEDKKGPAKGKGRSKKDILAELKKKSDAADLVYLAPDPDREGEAIAWHLKEALNLDDERIRRVTFNEITKRAIQEAFDHPTEIDMDRVHAQEARRFLDRVVGYKLSPLLRKKIARGLTAGRVQSVAVRLVVEREREIEAFVPEEFWRITANLSPTEKAKDQSAFRILKKAQEENGDEDDDGDEESPETKPVLKPKAGKTFLAELAEWDGKKFQAKDEQTATDIARALESAAYVVSKVEQKDRAERPQAPFTTSTLQQQANIRFGFSGSHTMSIAQKLYEGIDLGDEGAVALITYMRTDSTRVSQDALNSCRTHIKENYGDKYLPDKPHYYSSGKSAQEAHEAIRPTDLNWTPERAAPYLNQHQKKLYELIYNRFVASQMESAIWAVTNIEVQADKGLLKAQGKILKFDGYRKVLAPRGKQEDTTLPHLEEKQDLNLLDLVASQHFTQPPPRYKESSLVKAMEKEGIGRPSTYASIIQKIQERKYVIQEDRRFFATELGKLVTDKLIEHFPKVMDIKFTSRMEEELDQIEERKIDWIQVLNDFYEPFSQSLALATENMQASKGEETGETCPECNKPLVWRYSTKTKGTRFAGCSGYPECKYIKREGEEDRPAPVETEHKCPTCSKPMMLIAGQFGPFLRCSGHPECQTKMKLDKEGKPILAAQSTEHTCDKCGKPMVLREGPRGKFLGCSAYPKCRNLKEVDAQGNPIQPADTGIKCEKCSQPMVIRRGPRGPFLGCSAYPKCKSTKQLNDELREKLKDQLPPPKAKEEMPKVEIKEKCPECGAPLELRRGRRGFFLGCSTYAKTKCKGSGEVPAEVLEQIHGSPVGSGK